MIFTPAVIAFLIALSLFTAFLSGLAGMAGGMVLMGAMAWVLPVQLAMILHGATQLVSNGTRAFIHRKYIMRSILGYYLFGLITLLLIFQVFSYTVDRPITFIVLGLIPVLGYLPKKWFTLNILKPAHAIACGMFVTSLQLTAGVSGSALDLFFLNKNISRHQVVATKAITQAMGHTSKLYYFGYALSFETEFGISDIPPLLLVGLLVMTVTGTAFSKEVLEKISDAQFHRWTQVLITLIGVIYLYKGLSLLYQGQFGI